MAAEQVTEQVAEHLEEVAEVTRQIDTRGVRFFLGGVGFGIAVGFFIGYRFNREKIKAEAFKEAETEIENIREVYRQKTVAAEPKPSVDALVEELGYKNQTTIVEPERPLPAPVPISEKVEIRRVFRTEGMEKDKNEGWHYPKELTLRTSDRPHIIHQDEFAQNESEYDQVSYIYYAEDDTLVDENEHIVTNRDDIIGRNILTRFGHGTDDYNLLYIRNPVLELEIELNRSPGSYEEEVLGLPSDSDDPEEA